MWEFRVYANPYGNGEHHSMDHRGRGNAVVPFADMPTRFVGAVTDVETINREKRTRRGHPAWEHADKSVRHVRETDDWTHTHMFSVEPVTIRCDTFDHLRYYKNAAKSGHLVAADKKSAELLGTMGRGERDVPVFLDPMKVLADAREKAHAAWKALHDQEPMGARYDGPPPGAPPAPQTPAAGGQSDKPAAFAQASNPATDAPHDAPTAASTPAEPTAPHPAE